MTLDEFIETQRITPDNVDEIAERWSKSYHGFACSEFSFDCSPKGVRLGYENDIGYCQYSWKQVISYVKQPKQITFTGW